MTLTYSEDNQHLTRELAGIPLFLTFVKKKGSIYTPARSLISHLHALTRNEPARAVVTDKFNTFTLEQELNMDETLREFFNDVYEITRQIPRGKVLTYGRIAALAGPGMAPTTHPARKRGRHLPGQRVRGHEKALVGNLNCASFRRLLVTIHNFNDVAVIVPDGVAHPFTRSTLYVRDTNLVFFRAG